MRSENPPGRQDGAIGEVTLAGAGVHTGIPCRLDIRLAHGLRADARHPDGRFSADPGPVFRFPGFPAPLSMADLLGLPRASARSTILGAGSGSGSAPVIRTPEHLLAALLFFRGLPLEISGDGPELPGLDGSALPFREALSRLAPGRAAAPAWSEYPCDLEWDHHWEHGHIRIRPAAGFRVRYEWDRPPLRQAFLLESAGLAWREILPARSFAYHGEWLAARAQGLMAGAREDSGLLLAESEKDHGDLLRRHPEWRGGPFPLLNQPAWRMESEPAKHKILDLLGDLALAGLALPKAEIAIRNGGHRENHMLLARLAERPGSRPDPSRD